ncbi:MAG: molybdopterin-dependent oxidoreductase [SAR324 cluster bacterium]|nr:molybdopterin-dependent oxidoreductase [SAR324 cluster bacterium]
MKQWHHTTCNLCAQNCGLEVLVENNRIVRSKGDKTNPRSQGYVCRKGTSIASYQHHDDRLTHPLKRTPQGFEKISWEQAITEISEKLKAVTQTHGPKSYAFLGGGGQGTHFEAAFGTALMKAIGSRYHYTSLAQELTGYFWAAGRVIGRQNRFTIPDEHHAEMLLAIGWNGMVSHQMPQAPNVLREFASNPEKLLVVIDPRKSETAKVANIHLALRPGTDALLTRAMIATIIQNGWENKEYLQRHCNGFESIRPWFEDFDVKAALKICELDSNEVEHVCRELSQRKWCMHTDLGVLMNRHSTMSSYLHMILLAVCGRIAVPGGNVIPGSLIPLGVHTDERDAKTWKTVKTGFPSLFGSFPPSVLPEEILNDHPDRIRAVIVSGTNPLRSWPDTKAYEQAFSKLELLVTMEVAMTETAQASDYVLPIRSAYEAWDTTFFTWNFPEIYFSMRKPLIEPDGELLETGEIFTRIADEMGLIPQLPQYLTKAAKLDKTTFAMALTRFFIGNKKAASMAPMILTKTLGQEMKSSHLAALWGLLLVSPDSFREHASRAGFTMPSWKDSVVSFLKNASLIQSVLTVRHPAIIAGLSPKVSQSNALFQALLDHPEGLWIGKVDPDKNMEEVRHSDKRLQLYVPEVEDWVQRINPDEEQKELEQNADFPMVLMAGQHMPMNANTLMRNPEWNRGKRDCVLSMNPQDAEKLALTDGEKVRIVTAGGDAEIEVQVTDFLRKGQASMPHGFGLSYKNKTYGVNVNSLTTATHRDPFAGTPLHRYVPCRVEKLANASA